MRLSPLILLLLALSSLASPPAAAIGELFGGSGTGGLFGAASDEILPPGEAFRPTAYWGDDGELRLRFDTRPGHYLYRDRLALTPPPDWPALEPGVWPPAEIVDDEFFGETAIYRDPVELVWRVQEGFSTAAPEPLLVRYQGCADVGICYPPEEILLDVEGNAPRLLATVATSPSSDSTVAPSTSTANAAASGQSAKALQPSSLSEQDRLSQALGTGSLWLNLATFYGLGLLLAFTPCVLPMVPILSSIVVGQGASASTRNGFLLSLAYVLGMALTYTLVGVLVGLSGMNIQAWFQNPWILSGFALLFVLLALAMFGVFHLELPGALQQKLRQLSDRQSNGRFGGVAVMGALSALIVGPCVTAPLVGALIYIAETGDALVGGAALFALSIGMGTPLLLVGTSAGRWLPTSGPWMNKVTQFFGFVLLAMAIWMLTRFLDVRLTMLLASLLAIAAGIFLGATDRLDAQSPTADRVARIIGVVSLVYGLALGVGLLSGHSSYRSPLAGLVRGGAVASETIPFAPIKGLAGLNAALQQAVAEGKPLLLDFYADWCVSCKEMEHLTFPDPAVKQRLEQFVLVQADVTANDAEDKALLKHFGLYGPPAMLVFDRQGREWRDARVVGFVPAERFAAHLEQQLQRQ